MEPVRIPGPLRGAGEFGAYATNAPLGLVGMNAAFRGLAPTATHRRPAGANDGRATVSHDARLRASAGACWRCAF